MARRRFQNPEPFEEGKFWWIIIRIDVMVTGELKRKSKRIKLGPATMLKREAQKIASEMLRSMNQGLETIGSATILKDYVEQTYIPVELPLLAQTTQDTYESHLRKYVLPTFGELPMREITALRLQAYFSGLKDSVVGPATVLKIKETLSSVLGSARKYDLLTKNPLEGIEIPRSKMLNRSKRKPVLSVEELDLLLREIVEPYATMVNTVYFSGLRPSELDGLKLEDVHDDSLTVDEACCRGKWKETKTCGSSSTIYVPPSVISRIRRLADLEVEVRWGGKGAKKRVKVMRSTAADALVFQGLSKGGPMNDSNIRRRHILPAARKLGIDPKKATWQSLRRSYLTWLAASGANPKDIQAQGRHSRITTPMEIYAQHVPESQRLAVDRMMAMVESRRQELADHVTARSNSNPVLLRDLELEVAASA